MSAGPTFSPFEEPAHAQQRDFGGGEFMNGKRKSINTGTGGMKDRIQIKMNPDFFRAAIPEAMCKGAGHWVYLGQADRIRTKGDVVKGPM